MKHYAIIVAGGSGSRMGSAVPKQFLEIGGKPLLVHTLERFAGYSRDVQVILVLPEKDFEYWYQVKVAHQSLIQSFTHSFIETPGGATRFQSVRNGLAQIAGTEGLVAVHDGVRPFVPVAVIARSFAVAAERGTAVVSVPAKDSIRQVRADGSTAALDRATIQLVQTPQTFRVEVLKKAFEVPEQPFFTDDASVVEYAGYPIHLVEGSYENLKITTPEDLLWAEALLRV
jgi:2-C-methyl-D-erythritol 4-phosphate cytidylyltransferase